MAQYRAYVAGCDGRLTGLGVFVCANDDEAMERAKCLLFSPDIELWCGDRLVIGSKTAGNRRKEESQNHSVELVSVGSASARSRLR